MAQESVIDITHNAELLHLAEEVRASQQRRVLMRNGEPMAALVPVRERPTARPARRQQPNDQPTAPPPEYPTLESLAGAAGTLPEPKPFDQVLNEAREEHLARKFPPRHG